MSEKKVWLREWLIEYTYSIIWSFMPNWCSSDIGCRSSMQKNILHETSQSSVKSFKQEFLSVWIFLPSFLFSLFLWCPRLCDGRMGRTLPSVKTVSISTSSHNVCDGITVGLVLCKCYCCHMAVQVNVSIIQLSYNRSQTMANTKTPKSSTDRNQCAERSSRGQCTSAPVSEQSGGGGRHSAVCTSWHAHISKSSTHYPLCPSVPIYVPSLILFSLFLKWSCCTDSFPLTVLLRRK